MPGQPSRTSPDLSRLVMMLVAGLLVASGIFSTPGLSRAADEGSTPELVAVPDVAGMIGAEAIAAVREAGLEPKPVIEQDLDFLAIMAGLGDGELPHGVVIVTHPTAGEMVEVGSNVELMLPPEVVVVPDVVDLSEAEAVAAIEAASLVPALEVQRDKKVLEAWAGLAGVERLSDVVLYSGPRAGEVVEPGSTVKLTLAPALVAVPDVAGIIGAEAIAAIRAAGLEPKPVIEDDMRKLEMMELFAELEGGKLSYGEVYTTLPRAGELVEVGSSVELKLPARILEVPDVTALPDDVAVAAIEAAGLGVTLVVAEGDELETVLARYVDRPVPIVGSVLYTEPEAGARVTEGSGVLVWLAPELVTVPDVVGLPKAEAVAAIEAAGLAPAPAMFDGTELFGWDAYVPAGRPLPPIGDVISSSPAAGQPVEAGSRVEIGLMPAIVEVPDVMGLPEAEAVAVVEAAGLAPAPFVLEGEPLFGIPFELAAEPVPVIVAITDPLPGELAVEGSTVALGLPPDLVRVPDVTDLKAGKAAARMEAAGLVPEVVVERDDDFLEAVNAVSAKPLPIAVMGTSPEAGALAERGTTVLLHLPPKLVLVPDVLGKPARKAIAKIEAAGLVPEPVVLAGEPLLGIPYELAGEPVPVVVEITHPFPGTLVERGSTVQLGFPPDLVKVPDVVDLSAGKAMAKLEAAGLVPDPVVLDEAALGVLMMFEPEDEPLPDPDVVLYSDPVAGELAEKGSSVELAFPPLLVEVPDVVDMSEADAVAAVTVAGLVPGPVTVEDDFLFGWATFDEPIPTVVLATEPEAGQLAAAGSIVELYLPPELVADGQAPADTAQLVHTLFNLAPDEQGSTELVCTFQGEAILRMDSGSWSVAYAGESWHHSEGAAFVCGGGSGESIIVRGTYTLDPLTFTLDDPFVCDLDEFSFDGETISGVRHDFCGEGNVYTYEVAVESGAPAEG